MRARVGSPVVGEDKLLLKCPGFDSTFSCSHWKYENDQQKKLMLQKLALCYLLFKKWEIPRLFFVHFRPFQTNNAIFKTNVKMFTQCLVLTFEFKTSWTWIFSHNLYTMASAYLYHLYLNLIRLLLIWITQLNSLEIMWWQPNVPRPLPKIFMIKRYKKEKR